MVDRKGITVQGGRGGDGLISFRREKYVPFGGPDGGDGGNGGSVYIMASLGVDDLGSLGHRRRFLAENGGGGGRERKHGRHGEDLTLLVPIGTMVFVKAEPPPEMLIADVTSAGEQVLVARGGRGGLGNARLATAEDQSPVTAGRGKPGEERHIILELRLLTDMCIVGHPSSGKSALLAAISRARPEIADYPFTTRQPVLGVIQGRKRDFVVAEIPGLVEGAHVGRGLGNSFLRHVERTKLLIYLLDGTSITVVDDLDNLYKEVASYKASLVCKPKIVVVNKVDLHQVRVRLPDIRQNFSGREAAVFYVSAVSGQGVLELANKAMEMVERVSQDKEVVLPPQIAVFRPKPGK
jgi:GTP-binding protein